MVVVEVSKALGLRRLAMSKNGPKVRRLEVREHVDHTGEDSLRIWAILDDARDEKLVTGRWGLEFDSAIHDSLLSHGIDLFPYISIARESEWRALQTEA